MNPLQEINDAQLLNRYLLEDLGGEERERLEEDYLSEDDLYMKLQVAEDELIAAYVQGELSRSEHAKFERAYLTNPHRRRKVEATRELLNYIAGTTPPAPGLIASLLQRPEGGGWWRPVYAVAGLLLFAVCCALLSWLLIERRRMQGELNAAREELHQAEIEKHRLLTTPTPTPTPLEARDVPPTPSRAGSTPERTQDGGGATQGQERRELPAPQRGGTAEGSTPAVLAFTLRSPGLRTRGGNGSAGPLVIPRGVALVRLSVKVIPNEYEAYNVSLQKLGGGEVLHQVMPRNARVASGVHLRVELPASLLTGGDYILKVTGGDEILALHQLSVVKQDLPRK
jgi:hypothetical protein